MGLGHDIEINLPSIVIEGVGLNLAKNPPISVLL